MREKRTRSGALSVWTWCVVAVAAVGFQAAPPAEAQPRGDDTQRLVEILEGLEHGLVALERLGLREQHEQLQLVAEDLRGEIRHQRRRGGRERDTRGADRDLGQLAEQFQELIGVTHEELANVEGEIEQLSRDNDVTERVISMMREQRPTPGERGDRRERARLGRILGDYQRRLEDNGRQLEALHDQHARLAGMLERLEATYPNVESRLGQAERRHDSGAREELIAKLDRHVEETLGRYRQWSGDAPGPRREQRDARPRRQQAGQTELQVVEGQVGALQLALPALRETERRDAIELVERAIAARKTMLERRRDEEARHIRERAPGREQIVEILVLAERIYREFGMEDRAAKLSRMTEELWPQRERSRERARRQAPGPSEEAIHAVEVMRMALKALKEAERHDSAELLHRAIRAREVRLEGRMDREAAQIREQSPTLGQQIELLAYAAELWQEFGHEEKAKVVGELAERMRASWRRGEDRRRDEPRRETRNQPQGRRDAAMPRIEQLEQRLAEIEQGLEEIKAWLRATDQRRR
jgi:hypothetical protein